MDNNFKVGDVVNIYPCTGFGDPTYEVEISEEKIKYNEDTGKPYKIFKVGEQWFNEEGNAHTPPTMYYIYKSKLRG